MQHDYFQKIKCFDLLTSLLGPRVCVRTKYVPAWCSILHFLSFDLQHDYFQKRKKLYWLFDPTPGVEGGSMGKIFATILLYVSFPLIWYATSPYSEKVEFRPPPHLLKQPKGHNSVKIRTWPVLNDAVPFCKLKCIDASLHNFLFRNQNLAKT